MSCLSPDNLRGKWVVCYCEPEPEAEGQKICGEIIDVKPLPNFEPGNIPDCMVTLRGRTGRTKSLSLVAHYAVIHESASDAIAALAGHHYTDRPTATPTVARPSERFAFFSKP
jgi:hypothetical protein